MANKEVVKCVKLAGRGRGLVTVKRVRAGDIILRESPSLLYVAGTGARTFCCNCLRSCPSPSTPCPGCCQSGTFCSSACRSAHSTHLCTALSRIPTAGFDSDSENQARFLLTAYHLGLVSPSEEFEQLMHLEGSREVDEAVRELHALVEDAVRDWPWSSGQALVSLETTSGLLAKEARNAFGLMAPSGASGQRSVRGFGIYPTASFINHDCLPNSCRFDYLDVPGDSNTDIYVRALHDIPEKVEVTMSYFPINWTYKERQERLADEYGFKCICERCKVEKNWSEDENEDTDNVTVSETERPIRKPENENSAFSSLPDSKMVSDMEEKEEEEEEEEDEDDFEHAMFFVKYLCPVDDCGGTMAPLLSDSADAAFPEAEVEEELYLTMECNMCGHFRIGDEFRKDLQENGMLD